MLAARGPPPGPRRPGLEAAIDPFAVIRLVGGLIVLLTCGDFLVRGAVGLARRAGLSPLIIGLTVVAFGTSAPEFVTSLAATLSDAPGLAAGNIVGSNIANILLVLGVGAAMRPIACTRQIIGRDGVAVLLTAALFTAVTLFSEFSRPLGIGLLACLLIYVGITYQAERAARASASLHTLEAEEIAGAPESGWHAAALLTGGLIGIVGGANLMVGGAVAIARTLGISDAVIGLTVIAIGTSLPELATVIMASWRGHGDVALGNVLGSNIFNILAIAGGVSVITPLPVPPEIARFDIWVMMATSLLLLPLMISDWRLSRREGVLLLALYVVYLALQLVLASHGAA